MWPGNCWRISHLNGAYLSVLSCSFCSLLETQGLLISIRITFFSFLSTILASILLALTSVFSANTGTSQYAHARSFLYSGVIIIIIIIIIIILSSSFLLFYRQVVISKPCQSREKSPLLQSPSSSPLMVKFYIKLIVLFAYLIINDSTPK